MPTVGAVEQARELCAQGAWRAAYDALSGVGDADGLSLRATACYMLGRDEEYAATLERLHQVQLDAGDRLAAARTGFWLVMHLMLDGQLGRATGWLARAERLVGDDDCVERGYLLMPAAFRRRATGDPEGAAAIMADAAAIGLRFGDRELFGLATHAQGHILVRAGRVAEGLALLDEAMVAFSGRCHAHRAEIMQLKGDWSDALEEARCAARRAAVGQHRGALGDAAYVQGEGHRPRGGFGAAEEAYREASGYGREPYPGLALLRLEQGRVDAAVAAIRRELGVTTAPAERARLLPACAEITLAAGDVEGARAACEELAGIAVAYEGGMLSAIVAQTEGAVALAAGDPGGALASLRWARRVWDDVQAPYEAARVRALMGVAYRALGDEDAAALELDAARRAFAQLGAARDLARLDGDAGTTHGLTARELEVLRLVDRGGPKKED